MFGPKTFVIKSHDYACRSKGHTIRDINAVAMVLDKANNIVDHRVTAAFCEECDMLYMTPHAFEQLKKSGIPLFRTEIQQRNDLQIIIYLVTLQQNLY